MIWAYLFCCKNNLHTLFLSQKLFTHYFCPKKNLRTFFVAKTIYALFCRENNLRTSSGKFLRVESCHPESSDFLGLWGRQPPFLSDCTQGFSTAEESLWSQEGRCFSEQFQNAQHFFFASNNNFVNFTLSKSLKASFISEMKSSGISCKILSVFSQHTALTRTYIPEALLRTMVLTVFHFVQVRKS